MASVHGGQSRLTVVRVEKDMKVMIITMAWLTQKTATAAQWTCFAPPILRWSTGWTVPQPAGSPWANYFMGYLLLCHKIPPNFAALNNIYCHFSFQGLGLWEQISEVVPAQGLSWSCTFEEFGIFPFRLTPMDICRRLPFLACGPLRMSAYDMARELTQGRASLITSSQRWQFCLLEVSHWVLPIFKWGSKFHLFEESIREVLDISLKPSPYTSISFHIRKMGKWDLIRAW